MKKYQWKNNELRKKYQTYNYSAFGVAALAIACLYLLPGNLKMLSMVVLVVAAVLMVISWKAQTQDKRTKKNA